MRCPAGDHRETGEVGLPRFIRAGRLVPALAGRPGRHMRRRRDRILGAEEAVHG